MRRVIEIANRALSSVNMFSERFENVDVRVTPRARDGLNFKMAASWTSFQAYMCHWSA
jgi:hypothetical protein